MFTQKYIPKLFQTVVGVSTIYYYENQLLVFTNAGNVSIIGIILGLMN